MMMNTLRTRWSAIALVALVGALAGGCVQRTMTITSDPPGALVYLNDQEVGRTPLTRPFTWYGAYDVQVRKEGYQTIRTRTDVNAPWWQWVPIDLFAELLPLRDEQHFSYTLLPATTQPADAERLLGRAEVMRRDLQSSEAKKPAATTQP